MMQGSVKQVSVNLTGGCKFGRYPKISDQQSYNFYVSDGWSISFSGWKRVVVINEITGATGRGAFVSVRNNIVLTVINSTVYLITPSLVVSFIGNISTSVGPVFMDENLNNQIAIVDGLDCYIYNATLRTLTKQNIDDSQLIPNYVCYHNTYFLFGNAKRTANGSKWFAYSPETDTTIVLAKERALQTKPDYAIAVVRLPGGANNVLVFGYTVTELWTQTGGVDVYQRNQSLNIDYGCLSVSTIATSDRYVMWLAINQNNSPVIMLFSGNQNVAISNDGIDYLLGNMKFPQQSTGYFFRKDGHLFYILTFYHPEDNVSLCYDIETKIFTFLSDSRMNYFPPRNIVHFNKKSYFVNINNGSFYEIGTQYTTYDENIGNTTTERIGLIPRIIVSQPIRKPDASRFRSRNLTLTLDQGNDKLFPALNLTPTQTFLITEEDHFEIISENGNFLVAQDSVGAIPYIPRIELSISIDGAETFSSTTSIPMRPLGKRYNITNFPGHFGAANDLTFKTYFYTKYYVCVNNATLEVF